MAHENKKLAPRYIVPALERAILILRLLASSPTGQTLTDIGGELEIPKSSAFTLLSTLQYYNMVQRNPDGTFELGMSLFSLGSAAVGRLGIQNFAHPILIQLVEETNLAAHVAVLNTNKIVYINKVESLDAFTISSRLGAQMGVHCTALGKAIMAYLSESERNLILDQLVFMKRTENTITSIIEFQKELSRVRDCRFAIDDEENEVGIRCMAVPVFNHLGKVIAAISISGPEKQLSSQNQENLKEKIFQSAIALSTRLGFLGNWYNALEEYPRQE